MYEYATETGPFSEAFVDELHKLAIRIFGSVERSELAWKLSRMPDATVQVARSRGTLVGFKIGYAIGSTRYESWLGGIDPEHRRRGIALRMTENQHEWVQAKGYKSIETGMIPKNSAMLALNLRVGFHVSGMYAREATPRITMLKQF